MRRCWLLGAGFSRCVSAAMPLMHDLGEAVRQCLAEHPRLLQRLSPAEEEAVLAGQLPLADVELFLTSLTTDQPFLTAAERLARRSVALEVTDMIAAYMSEQQAAARAVPAPQWLNALVALWHYSRDAVLTLNYDVLIENALIASRLVSSRDFQEDPVELVDVLGNFPLHVPRDGVFGLERLNPTFRLLKLHGSLNWFTLTETNAVRRIDQLVGGWEPLTPPVPNDLEAALRGASAALLLPQADKSAGYGSAVIGSIWSEARDRLESCDELVVFGYSLPKTDSSLPALLSHVLRPDVPVTIVDACPEGVRERLRAVGLGAAGADIVPDQLATAVDGWLCERSADMDWAVLKQYPRPWYLAAITPDGERRPLARVRDDGSNLTLVADELASVEPTPYVSLLPIEHGPTLTSPWRISRHSGGVLWPMSVHAVGGAHQGTNIICSVVPSTLSGR